MKNVESPISQMPSDTKLLLTKNDSKTVIFEKLRISRVIPWKSLSFAKRPFVHNSVCSQFSEILFAIFAECSQFSLRSF